MIRRFANALLREPSDDQASDYESTGVNAAMLAEPQADQSGQQPTVKSHLYHLEDRIKDQFLHYFQQHVKLTPFRAIDEELLEVLIAKNRELLGVILKLRLIRSALNIDFDLNDDEWPAINHDVINQQPANPVAKDKAKAAYRKYVELDGALKELVVGALTKNYQFLIDHRAFDYDFKAELVQANNQCILKLMELPVKEGSLIEGCAVPPSPLEVELSMMRMENHEMCKQLPAASEVASLFTVDKFCDFFQFSAKLISDPFYCKNIQWVIVAVSKVEPPKQLELYLELYRDEFMFTGKPMVCNASSSFEILHSKNSERNMNVFFQHTFTQPGEGYGGPVALYDELVAKKFAQNDVLNIKFNLNITHLTFFQMPHFPSFPTLA